MGNGLPLMLHRAGDCGTLEAKILEYNYEHIMNLEGRIICSYREFFFFFAPNQKETLLLKVLTVLQFYDAA